MAVSSIGGNITSTISDHFSQFSSLNIHPKKILNQDRKGRSYRNFNHDEFDKELLSIDWNTLFLNKNCDDKVKIFLRKINHLLDEMAPIKKLSKKEIERNLGLQKAFYLPSTFLLLSPKRRTTLN